MDYKKINAPLTTVTRDVTAMSEEVGNVYEMVKIIAKRANQISAEMKSELDKKLSEFASYNDNIEEVFENRSIIYKNKSSKSLISCLIYKQTAS